MSDALDGYRPAIRHQGRIPEGSGIIIEANKCLAYVKSCLA